MKTRRRIEITAFRRQTVIASRDKTDACFEEQPSKPTQPSSADVVLPQAEAFDDFAARVADLLDQLQVLPDGSMRQAIEERLRQLLSNQKGDQP